MSTILHREYRQSERLADSIIHVIGVASGLIGCVVLAVLALPSTGYRLAVSIGLYGSGLMSMLSCSALYNMARDGSFKRVLRRLDHSAIFVMIAGTYTPFALHVIGGPWGIGLLAFVWTVALAGVMMKLCWPHRFERLSVVVYLVLGWSVVVAIEPLLAGISTAGFVLLIVGGGLYSLGMVFHLWSRLPFQNAIWHGFVLAAASCHYAAILHEVVLSS
ncbi:hemolysin III family protein [Vineibacter terrae]|uniref:Hemolysin III family protein n=1 Tax=Vineibacter terrae TaxID=2586908 RepID=A0A5C8PP97_9HYPH|nr:hemolysin III family protein [Vineibacter terrae]TXL76765.1 hemolysin III family protein [Vineibacter terrae]